MKKSILFFITLFLLSCSQTTEVQDEKDDKYACTIENPVEKGNRMIGIDLLDVNEAETFEENIAKAKELGIEFIALHMNWSSIETSPNSYQDPFNALALLSAAGEDNNMKFSLTIRPIDLTGKTVPNDLVNENFSSENMINRFKSLIDFVFTKVNPNNLLNLQIGNEIDAYDTSDEPESFWSNYGAFLFQVTNYVHEANPNVKVGFTGTLHGLLEKADIFTFLVNSVDLLGVTYYPLNGDFSVKNPDAVFEDLDNFLKVYPNKPIYMQEAGYQSSKVNNSSQEKQAEFYCNLFSAWDEHKDRIKSINILRLNDLSLEKAKESAGPYGLTDNRFLEYLRTLGIRTNNGDDKLAFEIIKQNLEARGW